VFDPRSFLLEYQHAFWRDTSRFKIGLWSRQSGKDFTVAGEAVNDAYRAITDGRLGTSWMIAAPSERQSLESLTKAKFWAGAFSAVVDDYRETREGGSSQSLLKSAEITLRLKNGPPVTSRIRAVPGKPETVRGCSSNVILTEYDFFEQPEETWRALLPSITNPLRGGPKVVRLITTPNGLGGAAYALWHKAAGLVRWSKHKVTIQDAVRMGLPVNIEELREAFGDAEGWAQEFECEFLDRSSVLFPYDLLALIESPLASVSVPSGFWTVAPPGAPAIDLGIDFGRQRDLTVCWALEDQNGYGMTREVLELAKMPTHEQLEVLRPRLARARRVCHDYTGPGIGLGDMMVAEFGEWNPAQHRFGKIELCNFTAQFKCELFPALRARAERRGLGIPVSTAIREDWHSVSRVVTTAGSVTYRAPHSPDGHADRCTAGALAARAQSLQGGGGALHDIGGIRHGGHARARALFSPKNLHA
jgi:phage FluMu gp28-like protein